MYSHWPAVENDTAHPLQSIQDSLHARPSPSLFHHPHLPSLVAYFPAVFTADQPTGVRNRTRARSSSPRRRRCMPMTLRFRAAQWLPHPISLFDSLFLSLVPLSSVTAAKINYLPLKDGATAVAGRKKGRALLLRQWRCESAGCLSAPP